MADCSRGQLSGSRADNQVGAVERLDDQSSRSHQRPTSLCDQLQYGIQVGFHADGAANLLAGVELLQRLRELLALGFGGLVAASVVDRQARECREYDESCFVVFVEGAGLLIGQVDVPVGPLPDQDRHTQERGHAGVACRESVGTGVGADFR